MIPRMHDVGVRGVLVGAGVGECPPAGGGFPVGVTVEVPDADGPEPDGVVVGVAGRFRGRAGGFVAGSRPGTSVTVPRCSFDAGTTSPPVPPPIPPSGGESVAWPAPPSPVVRCGNGMTWIWSTGEASSRSLPPKADQRRGGAAADDDGEHHRDHAPA